jgi:adenine-specific DNA-methyltransferase
MSAPAELYQSLPAPSFNNAHERIEQLVDDFSKNEKYYLSTSYLEARARVDFIDKFWIALGWDVTHREQKNPFEQEVTVEKNINVEGRGRRADYAFAVAPNFRDVRFFVEAKKPSKNIDNADDYFQTVRYGWNAHTPIAVLTDFEQFRILDCRYEPDIDSVLSYGALEKYRYSDYADLEKFRRIYHLFSRVEVANGSLESYAKALPKPSAKTGQRALFVTGRFKGVDESFLNILDSYRERLAHTFKASNPQLQSHELTEVTQRTLDRLVFLRFLEDKLIEPSELVQKLVDSQRPWRDFVITSRKLNEIYNGIIFRPHDLLDSPDFKIDERTFVDICDSLSYARSPYLFSYIPIHILGNIYERFLGKTIVIEGADASIQEKPEVRKAGGVYYTPEYIVRYIADNTVGQLIDGKTPEEISQMHFADISCGSGSFLLGVFDLLSRYHRTYYNANKKRKTKGRKAGCIELPDRTLQLSLKQKREILTNNIFGVDVDAQAVEVAQLSLYLKLLEDETTASARLYQIELGNKLLPSLSNNIKAGNSLIDWDILSGKLFDKNEESKLNPMSFKEEFPQIMKEGGFDAIVGNPPYVRIQGFPRSQINYFSQHYSSAIKNYDLYVSFIERGFELLKQGGRLGEIVPNKFFKTDYGEGLRAYIAQHKALSDVIDFGANQVFDATTYTCLLFLTKDPNTSFRYTQAGANAISLYNSTSMMINGNTLGKEAWSFTDSETRGLLDKLSKNSKRLLDLPADMSRGSSSGDDNIFILESNNIEIENDILRIPVFASDFGRYSFSPEGKWQIIFPYVLDGKSYRLYTEQELKEYFPQTYKYLLLNKTKLLKRKQYKEWFGYSAPRNLALHDRAQIIVPLLANRGLFTLIPDDTKGKLCPMASGGFTITISDECPFRPEFVLGVLNSKLLFWKLEHISNIFRGGWITCTKQYFGELPIPNMDLANPSDKAKHDKMVQLVEHLLDAKKQLAEAATDRDKNLYERKCANLDHQIDSIVYELYDLSPDEIAIVEES